MYMYCDFSFVQSKPPTLIEYKGLNILLMHV